MTLKYIWRSLSLGCHFHVHFSYPWHAFASHGLPAIAELLVYIVVHKKGWLLFLQCKTHELILGIFPLLQLEMNLSWNWYKINPLISKPLASKLLPHKRAKFVLSKCGPDLSNFFLKLHLHLYLWTAVWLGVRPEKDFEHTPNVSQIHLWDFYPGAMFTKGHTADMVFTIFCMMS